MVKIANKIDIVGLFQEKFKKRGHPFHPFEILRSKTNTDGNYMIFSCTPLEI